MGAPFARPHQILCIGLNYSDHAAETGSPVAQALLDQPAWTRFTKVMPRDYKKVMLAMEQARRDGTDVDEAVMAASKG